MTRSKLPQFPAAGLNFLRKLKRNNRREWFLQNKQSYEESVRQPMIEIVHALASEFAIFAPEIMASPKVSLYRIQRDTRFSKDKSPYKSHVAAGFSHRGLEKNQGAAFYLHIAHSEFLIGGGLYFAEKEELAAVRHHIADHHRQLKSILNARSFRKLFRGIHHGLTGEKLVRVPRGFPPDHPAADFLRRKQFLASRRMMPEIVTRPRFDSTVLETFRTLHPLLQFLNDPIVRMHETKRRRNALLN